MRAKEPEAYKWLNMLSISERRLQPPALVTQHTGEGPNAPAHVTTVDCEVQSALIPSGPVYSALSNHQQCDSTWELADLLRWLHSWKDLFICEFKLEVPAVSLCVEEIHWRRFGHFRRQHNGFGLLFEVALNRRYLNTRQAWEHLGTLLHEILHAWQHLHGRPGRAPYHNREFRRKAQQYGLVIDERGHTKYESDSAFVRLLREHGVSTPDLPPVMEQVKVRPKGQTSAKLRKWRCQCVPPINVWVAVNHFLATCTHCSGVFRNADIS